MVRGTRSNSAKDAYSEEVNGDEGDLDSEEFASSDMSDNVKIPESDLNYKRKFVITESMSNKRFYLLRHPSSSAASLYAISEDSIDEVLRITDPNRSFFYGESVIEDGSITVLSPIHPMFVVLPYLLKTAQNHFVPLDNILMDEQYPAIQLLSNFASLKKSLEVVCDCKEFCDTKVFRLNEMHLMEWLENRFNILKQSLCTHGTLHKSITVDEDVLRRYTYSTLTDYLPKSLHASLREHLRIKDPEIVNEKDSVNKLKRKVADDKSESPDESHILQPVQVKKPVPLSTAQKRLQTASKGTKSLIGFFTKK